MGYHVADARQVGFDRRVHMNAHTRARAHTHVCKIYRILHLFPKLIKIWRGKKMKKAFSFHRGCHYSNLRHTTDRDQRGSKGAEFVIDSVTVVYVRVYCCSWWRGFCFDAAVFVLPQVCPQVAQGSLFCVGTQLSTMCLIHLARFFGFLFLLFLVEAEVLLRLPVDWCAWSEVGCGCMWLAVIQTVPAVRFV